MLLSGEDDEGGFLHTVQNNRYCGVTQTHDPDRAKSPWSGEEQPSGFGRFQAQKGPESTAPKRMEKPTAAHNPEVVGSSPAPATTKTV